MASIEKSADFRIIKLLIHIVSAYPIETSSTISSFSTGLSRTLNFSIVSLRRYLNSFLCAFPASFSRWCKLTWDMIDNNYSGVGRGNGGNAPPPRNRKNVVEIWSYLPDVYTFEAEAEIIEKFSENVWKESIFHRDFDQKISKLS